MKTLKILLMTLILAIPVTGQKYLEKEYLEFKNPDELVTLSESIPFDQAIAVLSKVSEKNTGKKIVTTTSIQDPIGIQIEKMHYYKALRIISQYFNLIVEERENVIAVIKPSVDLSESLGKDIYAPVSEREINISSIIFEADLSELYQAGINWEFIFGSSSTSFESKLNSFTKIQTQDTQTSGTGTEGTTQQTQDLFDYTIGASNQFQVGDFVGDITAMFRYFENNNWGEVVSHPNVTVRNNKLGRIQIGSDLSTKQRDFAGNVMDVFIPTGTIIEVTPHLYTEDGINYVLLDLKVERSSGTAGQLTTEIKKIQASTQVLMLDGEETIIGGLYINEEISTRRGIPFLKDLPWWVFGLRYLTGYDETSITKKEVIILLKIDILPTLQERIAIKKENLIQQKLYEDIRAAEKLKVQNLIEELQRKQDEESEQENK